MHLKQVMILWSSKEAKCAVYHMSNDVSEDRWRGILVTIGHLSKNFTQDSQGSF